jgi:hypothetical protein
LFEQGSSKKSYLIVLFYLAWSRKSRKHILCL